MLFLAASCCRVPFEPKPQGYGTADHPSNDAALFQGITGTTSEETNDRRASGIERCTATREGKTLKGATPWAPPARNKAGRARSGVQGTQRWETERAGYPEEATPG
jgi:hypothetical protein